MKNFKKPNYNCFNLLEFCPFVLNTELGPLSSLACVVLFLSISGPSCSKAG